MNKTSDKIIMHSYNLRNRKQIKNSNIDNGSSGRKTIGKKINKLPSLIRQINYIKAKKLKFIKKKHPQHVHCSITISDAHYHYSEYNFTGRFKPVKNFLIDNSIVTQHYYNKNAYIQAESVQFKLKKGGKTTYVNKKLKKITVNGSSLLSLRFCRARKYV